MLWGSRGSTRLVAILSTITRKVQITDDGETVRYTDFCGMDVNRQDQQRNLINFAFFAFFLIPGKIPPFSPKYQYSALVITVMYGQIAIKLMTADTLLDKERSINSRRGKSTRNVIKMLGKEGGPPPDDKVFSLGGCRLLPVLAALPHPAASLHPDECPRGQRLFHCPIPLQSSLLHIR